MTKDIKAPAVVKPGAHVAGQATQWNQGEARVIAEILGNDLTDDDIRVYAAICRHTGLDPFQKQIYAWKDRTGLVVHIGVNGWRAKAADSGLYRGRVGPEWCGPDGEWRDVWLDETPPAAARCAIRRADTADLTWAVVTWKEWNRTQKRTNAKNPTPWDDRPAHMLGKSAESQAHQAALPDVVAKTRELIRQAAPGVTLEMHANAIPDEIANDDDTKLLGEAPSRWAEELNAELDEAGLNMQDVARFLGVDGNLLDVSEAVDAWLSDERRTVRSLVSHVLDQLAEEQA